MFFSFVRVQARSCSHLCFLFSIVSQAKYVPVRNTAGATALAVAVSKQNFSFVDALFARKGMRGVAHDDDDGMTFDAAALPVSDLAMLLSVPTFISRAVAWLKVRAQNVPARARRFRAALPASRPAPALSGELALLRSCELHRSQLFPLARTPSRCLRAHARARCVRCRSRACWRPRQSMSWMESERFRSHTALRCAATHRGRRVRTSQGCGGVTRTRNARSAVCFASQRAAERLRRTPSS